MNFRDRWETDETGHTFLFTVEMQRALYEAGLPLEPAALKTYRERVAPKVADPRHKPRDDERGRGRGDRHEQPVEDVAIDPATGKFIGRLIMFNGSKGFGFIARGADKIYFHQKKALDDPRYFSEGQKLLYDIDVYRGKEEAINVEEYEELID